LHRPASTFIRITAVSTLEEAKVDLGPPPTDFTLKQDYYRDCQQVVDHMRYAVQMDKGNPRLAEVQCNYYIEIFVLVKI
jgi:hypothetical protein